MRRLWLTAVAVAAPFVSGCYQYVPVDTTASPSIGKRLAFEVTDRGRVGLSERLGEGVLRLEGTVVEGDSAQVVMNVWSVEQLNGTKGTWTGERVRIDRNFVGRTFERQLSRGKTYAVSGLALAGLVLFVKSQGLLGAADVSESGDPPPPPPGQSRAFP
jgi:hypothetical protein